MCKVPSEKGLTQEFRVQDEYLALQALVFSLLCHLLSTAGWIGFGVVSLRNPGDGKEKDVCSVMFTLTKHCQCRLHMGFSLLCLIFVL